MVEVEVFGEVAEDWDVFADGWAWVGAAVGFGVEALSVEEVVFDELEVSIEGQHLVVDVARSGVGADDEGGYSKAVAVLIDGGRDDVIVEAPRSSHAKKIAVEFHSGLRITALMSLVT